MQGKAPKIYDSRTPETPADSLHTDKQRGMRAVLPQIPIPGYASLLCQDQNQRQLSQANSFSALLYTNSAIRVTPT